MQEFVFYREQLLKLIEDNPNSRMIAIQIGYEALDSDRNAFKATINAVALPPEEPNQVTVEQGIMGSGGTGNGNGTQKSMMAATALAAPDSSVAGCPNPPGCK